MFSKKLVCFSLMLLIITIGAVSAAENMAENDLQSTNETTNAFEDVQNEIEKAEMSNVDEKAISLDDTKIASQNSTGTHDSGIELSLYEAELIPNQQLIIHYRNSNCDKITGNMSCYLDDEIHNYINITDMYSEALYFDVEDCGIGNHTLNMYYPGDDNYKPFNQTFKFEITNVALIYNEIMYDYEYIKVRMPEDATGTVTLNINGTKKRYNVDNILAYNEPKTIYYDLDRNMKYGTYNLEIAYTGNYGNITKKVNFTKDYEFWLYDYGNLTEYVNENDVLFFYGVTSKITVFIDGVNINYNINDDFESSYNRPPNFYNGQLFDCAPIWLNRISLSEGYHTLEVKYAGDKTRPAKTITEVFYLNKPRLAKSTQLLINSNYPIEFIFPSNTTGNITVYTSTDGKNYKEYASADIVKNSEKISITNTKTGKKYVKVIYNTNNGNGSATTSFNVVPAKLEYYKWIELDPYYKETFTLKTGKKVTGTFSIYVNNKLYKSVKITKQTTKITLPNVFDKGGKNTITALWKTNYGTGKKSIKVTVPHFVTLKTVKVKKSAKKLTLQASLSKNNKVLKNKQVTFKFNGKTYKAKTNSKGIAKVTIKSNILKKLKVGKKITYQATYLKDTVKKTVKVQK